MSSKVTIQDIADALGISRNTVSKAINNSEGIAEPTRDKILKKAIEMGYKHFSYVQASIENNKSLSTSSQEQAHFNGEIALFTGSFLNHSHFASLMLDKFQNEISRLGFVMNNHRVSEYDYEHLSLPPTFRKDDVKAIICIEMFNYEYDRMLCNLGIPILFVDGPSKRCNPSLESDQLYMDNTTEIVRFVNGMLDKNIEQIGFIGDFDHCQSFYERYLAFRIAMLMKKKTVNEKLILKCTDYEDLKKRIRRLKVLPDLFICANDFVAIDTLRILDELNFKVPDDVHILGFDDSAESRCITPSLTTVHLHTQIMAFSALELLISRIKEPLLDYRTIYTETNLVCRETTLNIDIGTSS